MALTPLNFPNAPTVGQTYPNPPVTGQPTYTWDGADWISQFALGKAYVPLDGSQPMTGLLTLSGDPAAALGSTTKQYVDGGDAAAIALATSAMRGYLFGLTMSTAGASATLSVAPGAACDSTGVRLLKLAAAMAKTTAAWAAGGPAGGLDTGVIAPSAWYHWYLIGNPTSGAVDVVFSATATPQNGPTLMPAGFTLFRRIGAMKTNASSQWIAFVQTGDKFMWSAPVLDVSLNNPGTAAVTRTLSTPSGIITEAVIFVVGGASTSSADHPAAIYISDLALSDVAALMAGAGSFAIYLQGGGPTVAIFGGGMCQVNTNTSSQVRSRLQISASGTSLTMTTLGWNDQRGRLY